MARITARRWYTAIRALELGMTIAALTIFYALIAQIGSEAPGPGTIGLLFVGIALGLLAYGAVVLRTLTEYYDQRRRSASSRTGERGENDTD
jgi:uncharacterized protein (DUF2062 family)